MTTVGELFVGLGVKGSEKSVSAITGVRDGLDKTKGMALETKAAIIGAVYAFEQMFSASLNTGAALDKFSTITGVSSQTLERYQYAARQVNVSNESVTKSFVGLSDQMTKTLLGHGAPTGMVAVMKEFNFGPERLKEFMEHPNRLIQVLQKFAQNQKGKQAYVREVLSSFGLDNEFIASLMKNAYRKDVLDVAPTHSTGDVKQLARTKALVSNLETQFSMGMDKIAASPQFERLLTKVGPVITELMKLSGAFVNLADKIDLVGKAGSFFKGWENILNNISNLVEGLSIYLGNFEVKEPGYEVETSAGKAHSVEHAKQLANSKGMDPNQAAKEYEIGYQDHQRKVALHEQQIRSDAAKASGTKTHDAIVHFFSGLKDAVIGGKPGEGSRPTSAGAPSTSPAPNMPPAAPKAETKNNMSMQQINNFHGVKDAEHAAPMLASVSNKAVKDTFLSLSQSQGA